MTDLNSIGDTLIDTEAVLRYKERTMHESYESYSRAVALLGYFSQLHDYRSEYDRLMQKVILHRKEFIDKYKLVLINEHSTKLKQMLIPPTKTDWYNQGINKYNKVKNYSMYYYRRKLYITLEEPAVDVPALKHILDTIISLDKYYDIYEDTIGYFMQISSRFEELMRSQFSDRIHL